MTSIGPAARAVRLFVIFGAAALAAVSFSGMAAAQSRTAERPAADRATPSRGVVVRQINLVVEDMDRAIEFYQRVGLHKIADRTFEKGDQDAVFGPGDLPLTADPKSTRFVIMKGATDDASAIGLLSYDRPRLSSARGSLAGLGTGDVVITIEVPDMQDAYRHLSQGGTRFQRLPYRSAVTMSDGTRMAVERMLAFDPDGHLAEVIQRERP